jgi:predicted glycosyltransferase
VPSNRLYYSLKPYLPWRVRMAMRRFVAHRKLRHCRDVWPINEAAGNPPAGWPGWPAGKKFALVLTHDVEGPQGLAKCRQLMELEMELGFRSSFNFIPEGGYAVPRELREKLAQNGFEVGVQDLKHDGTLFQSRESFRRGAIQINRYLREWNAVGFRSGFMFHNLEWAHDLDVDYSSCTFDTDPFEPQPDDVGTIFPFWVPAGAAGSPKFDVNSPAPDAEQSVVSGQRSEVNPALRPPSSGVPPGLQPSAFSLQPLKNGYVELPYTLPQDSTLFLLLQETSPNIWLRKLHWLVQRGGMALLNAHPDYMDMEGKARKCDEYPVKFYGEFLEHIRSNYQGLYWNGLPKEVASHAREVTRNRNSAAPPRVNGFSPAANRRPKIWIDLDNTPHVPFFEPIIEELRVRGFPVLVTARDAFQVCDLADKKGLRYLKIGRHYGKNRLHKAAGLAYRALQLSPVVFREKPALGVSHGARSQILLSNWLGIPTLLLEDYEHAMFPPMMHPTWVMAPTVIPDAALCGKNGHIRKYPGIKEDVYAWKLNPDSQVLTLLKLDESDLIVIVRPPATEAHYHNPESEKLFEAFMNRACGERKIKVVLLPRNKAQAGLIQGRWPEWFKGGKTIIPAAALDGMNLIWHSDLVVSGGGTMNREAAALGVPVYSIFRGPIGAVDRHLQSEGRLVLIESVQDVQGKIPLVKRTRKPLSEVTSRRTLQTIVDAIQEIVETKAS